VVIAEAHDDIIWKTFTLGVGRLSSPEFGQATEVNAMVLSLTEV
jgi:hypothetical protein